MGFELEECYPDGAPEGFPVELFAAVPLMDDTGAMVVRDMALRARIETFQEYMLTLPQQECPVVNLFASGVYGRQITIPKGTMGIGKIHLQDQINFLLAGDMTMLTVDGPVRVKAPAMFVSPAGHKKFGYANETTIWATVQLATCGDPDQLVHDTCVDTFADYDKFVDMLSYRDVLEEFGYTENQVQHLVQNPHNLLSISPDEHSFIVAESYIHGLGIFSTVSLAEGDVIGPALLGGMRTQLGRYTNHAASPNATMRKIGGTDDVELVALQSISANVEITTHYGDTLRLLAGEKL